MNGDTILIVDDEQPIRHYVERVLRNAGYVTASAGGAQEALAVAATIDSLGLLITDLLMPQVTGDELARLMRQARPDLKVLYLTGYCDRLVRQTLTLREGEAFLEKPCNGKGLLEAVALLRNNTRIGDLQRSAGTPRPFVSLH